MPRQSSRTSIGEGDLAKPMGRSGSLSDRRRPHRSARSIVFSRPLRALDRPKAAKGTPLTITPAVVAGRVGTGPLLFMPPKGGCGALIFRQRCHRLPRARWHDARQHCRFDSTTYRPKLVRRSRDGCAVGADHEARATTHD
jgi:hypothetical protein